MKYTIHSLHESGVIRPKNDGMTCFKDLFENKPNWAIADILTSFEFDDDKKDEVTFIHLDANGNSLRKTFVLNNGKTHDDVINRIKERF